MESWVDLVKTVWDCGIFDRILYSKVVPFQITIPVAHVTDVEFARSLDMFTDPHCGHATRRKN